MESTTIILTIQHKKRKTKNILIIETNYEDLVIYFTKYDRGKLIRMSSLYYLEFIRKMEEYQGKNI